MIARKPADDCKRLQLAAILDLNSGQVRRALADEGHLLTSGLVEFEEGGYRRHELHCLFKAMPQLVRVVLDPFADPDGLFHECLHPAAAPELRPADYAHIRRDFNRLTQL